MQFDVDALFVVAAAADVDEKSTGRVQDNHLIVSD